MKNIMKNNRCLLWILLFAALFATLMWYQCETSKRNKRIIRIQDIVVTETGSVIAVTNGQVVLVDENTIIIDENGFVIGLDEFLERRLPGIDIGADIGGFSDSISGYPFA